MLAGKEEWNEFMRPGIFVFPLKRDSWMSTSALNTTTAKKKGQKYSYQGWRRSLQFICFAQLHINHGGATAIQSARPHL